MKRFQYLQVIVIAILALFLCSCVSRKSADEIAIYVSPKGNDSWAGSIEEPFATIQRARDAIREMKKKEGLSKPVTVYIRGGMYELSRPIVFTPEDSGTKAHLVTYSAYKNEKPVISGGRKITGPWKDYKDEIKVCSIPEVKEGKWNFRQLFLRGERQQRSRIPNESYYRVVIPEEDIGNSAFKFRENDFKRWSNINDIEVVIYYSWNESRFIVSELDFEKNIVRLTSPIDRHPIGWRGYTNRYYIENVLEGLDREGEWYLDRHTGELYYWLVAGGKLSELRAPVTNELIRFDGDVEGENHIQYINIRGLTFCDADYILPKEGIPAIRDVGDIWFPSAITLKGVSNCVFEDNTIRNVGTYGLDITGDGNKIIGNTIYDTGSGGIVTRSYGRHRNIIMYNHIHHCGLVFHGGVGINIDDGGGLIANNLIHHTSHSGIYVRHFATDYGQKFQRRNQEQGLVIEYNEIYDVMHGINDGAGIFVRDDHIVIRNNLIHDVWSHPEGHGSPGWGIYLGCDTRNCLVENNVVYRAEAGQLVWHNNKNNTIYNNIFIEGGEAQYQYTNPEDLSHEKIRLFRNIIYFSGPDAVLYYFGYGDGAKGSLPMESDYNIIYHTEGKELRISGYEGLDTFDDWKKHGFDTHSIIADPLFVDPENDNYSLRPESPAFKLGFKPIDLSRVGLRGRKSK